VPDALLLSNQELLTLNQITISTGGAKANAARLLEELSVRDRAGFRTPEGVVVPLGIMERALSTSGMKDEYLRLIAQLSSLKADDFMVALARLRDMIAALRVPQDIVSGVINSFRRGDRLMVRSSSNCEDIEGFTGAGLYDSVANVAPSKVAHAVSAVWSSLWNWRAALSREKAGIPHEKAHMAVLVQQMVVPDFSFIVHTINPVSRDHDEVYMELAVGLGGTLASAETPGGPYRMVFNKKTEKIQTLAFASFGSALYPGPHGEVMHKTVDYSGTGLSSDEEFRNTIGCNIGSIGRFVEKEMGRPQDIEGVITENTIYLVQSRPLQADI
jgi:phosphoglucan,water dikinase